MSNLLFDGPEWTFELLSKAHDAIEDIALNDLGLDVYPNQIEIISADQMMDAYSSVGMPVGYHHWSFGKQFLSTEQRYRKGHIGLAYELVINSNPCIAYLMEENTLTLQALVIAHACFGHNSFFKCNYLFKEWTDAGAIVNYILFARDYITECEERHGVAESTRVAPGDLGLAARLAGRAFDIARALVRNDDERSGNGPEQRVVEVDGNA